MAVYVMLAAALSDVGFWTFPRTVSALFFGDTMPSGAFGTEPVLAGAAIHLLLAPFFGIVCAVLIGVFTAWVPVFIEVLDGMMYGLFLWGFNTLLIAPLLPGAELVEDLVFLAPLPGWVWATGNVLYGALLGLLYGWWRGGATEITTE